MSVGPWPNNETNWRNFGASITEEDIMTRPRSERLPLARTNGDKTKGIPTPDALNKVLEVVGNKFETLQYFATNLHASLEKSGLVKECKQLLQEVENLVANAQFREDNKGNPWLGDTSQMPAINETDFNLFQKFLATTSATELKGKEVILDCALSDSAEFLRAYSNAKGELLEDEELNAMDTLFNAWLAENDMISKGGVIYAGTTNGDILEDKKGKPVVVPAEKLRAMLDAGEFAQFVQKKNPEAQVNVRLHPYEAPQAGPE
jgi:hypothetical protein